MASSYLFSLIGMVIPKPEQRGKVKMNHMLCQQNLGYNIHQIKLRIREASEQTMGRDLG